MKYRNGKADMDLAEARRIEAQLRPSSWTPTGLNLRTPEQYEAAKSDLYRAAVAVIDAACAVKEATEAAAAYVEDKGWTLEDQTEKYHEHYNARGWTTKDHGVIRLFTPTPGKVAANSQSIAAGVRRIYKKAGYKVTMSQQWTGYYVRIRKES
jgi:hypothetical protein